jgi:CIC family chloride channel protein
MKRGFGPGFARLLGFLGLGELGFVGKWVGISTLIGFAGGLAAFGFERLLHFVRSFLAGFSGVHAEGVGSLGSRAWILLVLLPAGGLVVGLLTSRFAPEAEGHGTEHLVRAFHELGGRVRGRVIWLKALCSAITIGSGGSAGQEGPAAQIGSGVGSTISDALRLSERDRRLFLLAGSSAGIGALFTAPLGAALFAPEVLYRKPELEGEAIVPCIISSIVAYTTFRTLSGQSKAVPIPDAILSTLALHDPRELGVYVALAILCAPVSWLFVRAFEGIRAGFRRLSRVPAPLRPALGGLLVALLALALARWPATGENGVLFGGYELMEASIVGSLPIVALAGLALAKILATSITIGSGGSGGMFAPSLAIGALLGAIVGQGGAQLFPDLGIQPACYALVGMGGFFAGLAKTPIASILIVCEMTGSYELLAPLMLVSVLHLLLSRSWTIYGTQVPGIIDSPAHAGDFVVDVLEGVHVADVLEGAQPPQLVPETATLRSALDFVAQATGYYFPVVDARERMVGIFSLSDVRRIFQQMEVADVVIVRDFMVESVVTTTPGESLNEVLHKLNEHGLHEIPVVDEQDPARVLAMLTRHVVGAAYHRRLELLKRPAQAG